MHVTCFVVCYRTVETCRVQEAAQGKPRVVAAGHKNPSGDDSPRVVSATHPYILDLEELAEKTTSTKALREAILARYPDWLNHGVLWSSATAAKD